MHLQKNPLLRFFKPISGATLHTLKMCFDRTEGMVDFEEALLLYCLSREVQNGCIVEIGSYRGRSTVFLARGSIDGAKANVYAIDPHKQFMGVLGGIFGPQDRIAFYKAMLENGCSEIVSLINLSSEYFAPNWKEPVSLLWIDGDHRHEGVKRDFELWMPYLVSGATIAFDDATNPNLGPSRIIDELIASTCFEKYLTVGKVIAVRKK